MKKVNSFLLFGVFLATYALLCVYVLFFKFVSPFELLQAGRRVIRTVNWIPFSTILSYLTGKQNVPMLVIAGNVLGNIVLFMPLGAYLELWRTTKGLWRSVLLCISVSVFVEAMQYVLGVGYTDIDDVILNGLGGLLGVLTVRGLFGLVKTRERVCGALVALGGTAMLVPVLLVTVFRLRFHLG